MTNQDDFLRLRNLAITHMSVNPQFKGATIYPLTGGVESYHYKGNSLNFQFVHGDDPYIRIYLNHEPTNNIIEEQDVTVLINNLWTERSSFFPIGNEQKVVEIWLEKLRNLTL